MKISIAFLIFRAIQYLPYFIFIILTRNKRFSKSTNLISFILGSRLWRDTLNVPSLQDGSLHEIYQSAVRITNEFFNKGKRYDSKITSNELFKASRLVWFMIAFQMQLNLPLALSDSMFGYNMLYPYTDDLIDCNDVSREAKTDFAHIFHQRLLIRESNYNSKKI